MNPTPTTRASLLLRLADPADQQAWADFVTLYEPLVHRLLRKSGLQDADLRDVTQEVFLAVSRNVARFEPIHGRGSFRGWLRTVTRNFMVNLLEHCRCKPAAGAGSTDMIRLLEEVPAPDAALGIDGRCRVAAAIVSSCGRSHPQGVSAGDLAGFLAYLHQRRADAGGRPIAGIDTRGGVHRTQPGHCPPADRNRGHPGGGATMSDLQEHLQPEALGLLIVGDLSLEAEARAAAHLEECPTCQMALETAAGERPWWADVSTLLRTDEDDLPPPGVGDWSVADFSVDFLEPAAEPTLLGRLGEYEIHAVLGRGGMGVVLKARDPQLNRFVAIEALAPQWAASEVARRRFAREAQAAAAVVHPNVIAIHQVQVHGRLPFLVMPLVSGESLQQRLAARGPLELVEILRIGMQAAAGLAAAHDQGLVHRDVKPANILLEFGVERAVLTDFGLARAADDRTLTQWGVIAGTPAYMSPEQTRGKPLDCRSDLFSLGCVLHEMATGMPPFQAEGTLALLRKVCEESSPLVSSLRPGLPPWFDRIVQRLLSKDPDDRIPTAHETADLLEQCLAHVQDTALPLPANLVAPRAFGRRAASSVWGW